MPRLRKEVVGAAFLGAALGLVILRQGAVTSTIGFLPLVGIGLAGVWCAAAFAASSRFGPGTLVQAAALLLPAYVALQLVPLPETVLRALSPARAELNEPLAALGVAPGLTAFSVSDGATWAGWFWVSVSTVLFFVVGRLSLADGRRRWSYTAPLLLIGTLEAILGLAQSAAEGRQVAGTFESPGDFAAFIGMVLPLGLAGLLAVLTSPPVAKPAVSSMLRPAIWLLTSVVLFAGIAASFSKTAALATVTALFAMAVLEVARRAGRYRQLTVSGGVLIVLAGVLWFAAVPLGQRSDTAGATAANGRRALWQNAGRLIAAYPLVGVGLGNFHPAILRYQDAPRDLTAAAAGNEIVRLLAELGLIGSAIALTLFGAVLVRASRTAMSAEDRDARLRGLGCAGSLVAIGVHGLAGSHTYGPAHALVLAWIAGLGASLPPAPSPAPSAQPANRVGIVRGTVLGLSCLVVALGIARLVYLGNYSGDAAAERLFCRIGICDEGALNARLTAARNGTGGWPSLDEVLPYLRRSPARADLWVNVAAAAHRAGQSQAARLGFERAVQLAPFSRSPLLEAASYFFDTGAREDALMLSRRCLEVSPTNDRAVFALARAHGVAPATVLRRIVTSTAEARSYMRWLMQPSQSDGMAQAWTVIVKRGHADAAVAAEYAELLVERQQPQAAWEAWDLYARAYGLRRPDDSRVSNGDFELNPAPTRFDWRISKSAGIVIRFDSDVKYSGGRSLRIAFNDAANPTEIGVRQVLYLEGRRYRFTAYFRTEGISTDQGIGFTIVGEGSPALETTTRALRGTNDWTAIEHEFDGPPGGGLVRVSLTRQRSFRFDDPMRGTVWVDGIRLTPAQ